MTDRELEDHIAAQSQTIEEQKILLEQKEAELSKIKEAQTATPVSEGEVTAEQVKAWQDKEKQLDAIMAENSSLKKEVTLTELKKKHPKIKDWSVIPDGTADEMSAVASKIEAMIPDAPTATPAPEGKEVPAVNPGDAFKNVPGQGSPTAEATQIEEKNKIKADMDAAAKEGRIGDVLEGCLKAQPNALKNLYK